MTITMLLGLLENISVIAVIALIIGQLDYFRNIVYGKNNWMRIVILSTLFGFLSVIGTENGLRVNDALANTRIVGAVAGGLIGGPVVGFFAGLIGGIHRYSIGGFTAFACAISTVMNGYLAGIVSTKMNMLRLKWQHIVLIGVTAELIQKVLVLLMAKPFSAALELEVKIAIPTTIMTIAGLLLFTRVFQNLKMMQDQSGALGANLALSIASQTLPHLRTGLNEHSANKTAELIREMARVDAVAITDREKLLSAKGHELENHVQKETLCTQVAEAVLNHPTGTWCDKDFALPRPPRLKSISAASLYHQNQKIGTLQFYYKTSSSKTSQTNEKLVDGLAKLLSVQIELAEIEHQAKMRKQAEVSALQAQINPHFLFNTLGTIMSYCRTDPDQARNLIGHLSDIFRRNLKSKGNHHSLQEELDGIKSYLEIEKVRFSNRLKVNMEIDESLLERKLPVLTLQPIVENAIHHGLSPKVSDCLLTIRVEPYDHEVKISIEDNGVGISEERLAEIWNSRSKGIGLVNVHSRLQSIYGKKYGLTIQSQPGLGTVVSFVAPLSVFEKEVHPDAPENNHHR
ncbi:two-component system sensor histidine kinase LytS [Brevibacillus sp. AG162]|uniref:LytS/YhcK type 5TM receptor domain-containing protein n=1 Tax=Brevibacillus sp. AG162 TaxID=2572910 RepID=UPI00114E0EE9|nr:LytS/YhcK type 5TM receptor domain-containing protein [Brevibacillus sp. AG162]TQK74054.1 two-component system sensor histidine kinase LytS [Brevibacillus sp. AG162]